MYLKYITEEEVSKFMEKFVKRMHIDLHHCNENCCVALFNFKHTESSLEFSTAISDHTGSLSEDWILTPYKALKRGLESGSDEIHSLTKLWSRYLYSVLKTKDAKIAEEYKNSFIDYIKRERDGKIQFANNKYKELVF